jgi:transcriptional regulator with XRE-family HTH domain
MTLKEKLAAARISQEQVAKRAGVRRQTVQGQLSEDKPSPKVLEAARQLLAEKSGELLAEAENVLALQDA